MRAYNMAMSLIFVNCGMAVAAAMGAFGSMSKLTGIYQSLQILTVPILKIGPFNVTGMVIIVGLLIGGTVLFLNSRPFSSQGVAYGLFFSVFWGSVATSSIIFYNITDVDGNPFPGISVFIAIFLLASTLIFINAFVQMPTGGQKSHV